MSEPRWSIPPAVARQEDWVRRMRREIHRRPELSGEERETAALVTRELRHLGLEPKPMADTGVLAVLRGARGGPAVLWRADLDALPIQEATGLPFASEIDGVMHACGHDCHTAVALGLARVLAEERRELRGTVVFAFQPAEEAQGGAARMIQAGALTDPPVSAVLAYHVSMESEIGTVLINSGPTGAGCQDFRVELQGRSGHGAHPDAGLDPIPAAAQIILALHGLRGRVIPQEEPAALTVGTLRAGTRSNVLAEEVWMEGTIRALSESVLDTLTGAARRAVEATARAWGAEGRLHLGSRLPPVINDPGVSELVRREALEVTPSVRSANPGLGAEDVALFLKEVPGCFLRVGAMNGEKGCLGPHHASCFQPDEDHLAIAMAVGYRAIHRLLREPIPRKDQP